MTTAGVIRLLARDAGALSDPRLRDLIIATAHGISERTGVTIVSAVVDEDAVELSAQAPPIVLMGLAAELRRVTNAWYAGRTGRTLWAGDDGAMSP